MHSIFSYLEDFNSVSLINSFIYEKYIQCLSYINIYDKDIKPTVLFLKKSLFSEVEEQWADTYTRVLYMLGGYA